MSADQEPREIVLDASTPVRDAARAILDARLKAVHKRVDHVRESEHAQDQDVHGLRVATRRASAALSVFGPIAREKDLRRTARMLRKLRRSAAIARSADVHGAMVLKMLTGANGPRAAACGFVLGRIASERSLGRVGLCDTAVRIGVRRLHRTDDRLIERLRSKHALGASTFGEVSQIVITDCFDRLELAMVGDFTSPERLHEFRLAVKRFRYRLEVLEPCLDPGALDDALARAKALQQRLGDLNDLVELEARLEHLAHELEDSDRAAEFVPVITGLRVVQGEIDRAMREKREAFIGWWGSNGSHAALASLRANLLTIREPSRGDDPPARERPRSAPSRAIPGAARAGEASAGGRP